MAKAEIDFDAADLAARIAQLSPSEIDALPFGVVALDREGRVLFYSATEARLSGYGMAPLGKNFFDVSQCAAREDFRSLVMGAMENANVDLDLAWCGDANDPEREMRIRIQSVADGGVWLFIARDIEAGSAADAGAATSATSATSAAPRR
jgi:photoactive yellow protein